MKVYSEVLIILKIVRPDEGLSKLDTVDSAFFGKPRDACGVICDVTRSVSKMTEIERRGGKRWDKPKKAGKSRDCRGGKF